MKIYFLGAKSNKLLFVPYLQGNFAKKCSNYIYCIFRQ